MPWSVNVGYVLMRLVPVNELVFDVLGGGLGWVGKKYMVERALINLVSLAGIWWKFCVMLRNSFILSVNDSSLLASVVLGGSSGVGAGSTAVSVGVGSVVGSGCGGGGT